MAQIIYAARALADLERLTEFLIRDEPAAALETADLIIEAVQVLGNHPFVGRLAEHGFRELVISRGRSGYLALYSYEPKQDTVLILAIWHQREAGYLPEQPM